MLRNKHIGKGIIFSAGLLLAFFIVRCKYGGVESEYNSPQVLATHFNGENFVGSHTCIECHADIYVSHIKTAHYRTSALADTNTVKGSFKPGSNTLDLKDIAFEMKQVGRFIVPTYQHQEQKCGYLLHQNLIL